MSLRRRPAPISLLHDIGFEIAAGEALAVAGESRCGKTVLLRALLGLEPPGSPLRRAGSVRLPDGAAPGARLGVLAQGDDTLAPSARIDRQLAEVLPPGADPAALLDGLGVAAPLDAYPHQLGAAQRRGVALARALGGAPALLLLDEPAEGLGVAGRALVARALLAARARGAAILLLTRDLAQAGDLCDRVLMLHAGRVVERGEAGRVLADPAHPYTIGLLAAALRPDAERGRKLAPIQGEPPLPDTPADTPPGCGFRGRCPAGTSRCAQQPELRPAAQHGGQVACWHANAPRRAPPPPARLPSAQPSAALPVLRLVGAGVRFAAPRLPFAPRRPAVVALDGIDLHVGDHEAVAVLGGHGAGKTTLLRLAAGLLRPSAGSRQYNGAEPPQMLFRGGADLPGWLRVGAIVGERLVGRGLSAAERATRVEEALAQVQLPPDFVAAAPADLSPGQARRVALARALIVPPALLICDEPEAGLDASAAAMVLGLINGLRRELRLALLVATEDRAVARYLAERAVVVEAGRLAGGVAAGRMDPAA